MKRIVTLATASAVCALLATSVTQADDYSSGIVTKAPAETYTDVEFGSGWYLRGDISYNFDGQNESGSSSITPSSGGSFAVQADYDDAVGVGVGAGYQINSNLRAELNLASIFSSSFDGTSSQLYNAILESGGVATPTTTGGTRRIEADYQVASLIASANIDLGTFGAFTPYVGAGAGIARIEYNETETLSCVPFSSTVTCVDPAGSVGETVERVNTSQEAQWTYAYQLTAGTAIAVDERTSLDLSYSFTQIGNGDTINYADGTAIAQDGVKLHQIKAGFRYSLN